MIGVRSIVAVRQEVRGEQEIVETRQVLASVVTMRLRDRSNGAYLSHRPSRIRRCFRRLAAWRVLALE